MAEINMNDLGSHRQFHLYEKVRSVLPNLKSPMFNAQPWKYEKNVTKFEINILLLNSQNSAIYPAKS